MCCKINVPSRPFCSFGPSIVMMYQHNVGRRAPLGWTLPPLRPILLPVGHIHVWRACLACQQAPVLLDAGVPEEEHQTGRSTVSRLSRLCLLNILSRYIDVPARSLQMKREPSGKPFIRGGPAFNIAHTKDVALIAVSLSPIGIDLERVDRPIRDIDRLLSRFCKEERDAVRQARDARRAVLTLWTRKEAFVKCTGEGIRRGLKSFQVDLGQSDDWLVSIGGSPHAAREFYGGDIQVDKHAAAIVARSRCPPDVTCFEWTAEKPPQSFSRTCDD